MPRNYPVPRSGPTDSTSGTQYDGVLFAPAARSQTGGDGSGNYNGQEYVNPGAKGLRLFVNVTANTGNTGTLTVKIQNFDPASQTWMDLPDATTGSIATVTGFVLTLYPGALGKSTGDANYVQTTIGVRWRAVASVGTASVTFSVGADYLDR